MRLGRWAYGPREAILKQKKMNDTFNRGICSKSSYTLNYTKDAECMMRKVEKETGQKNVFGNQPGEPTGRALLRFTTRPPPPMPGFGPPAGKAPEDGSAARTQPGT